MVPLLDGTSGPPSAANAPRCPPTADDRPPSAAERRTADAPPHNPARQTRRAKRRPTSVYRLSSDEVVYLLRAVDTARERRAIYLGVCAGLRSGELRGLQGRHFDRSNFVWISADIAKGKRERWVPVSEELSPVVREIRATFESDDYVLPAQRWRDPGVNREKTDKRKQPMSAKAL